MEPDIRVYTSNGWGPCHMVKVYLSRKDVPFTEHNVSIDREGLNQLVAMGYRTTPVTTIGEHRIVGYSPPKLDAALKDSGIEV